MKLINFNNKLNMTIRKIRITRQKENSKLTSSKYFQFLVIRT